MTETDRLNDLVRNHALMLREHFDTVQILATSTSPDGKMTETWTEGFGNLFARISHARIWAQALEESVIDETIGGPE